MKEDIIIIMRFAEHQHCYITNDQIIYMNTCVGPQIMEYVSPRCGGGRIQGGVNCSVPDIINTLGGGPAVFKTLTTMVGNCGGVTSYLCKTLTTMVGNCGWCHFIPV